MEKENLRKVAFDKMTKAQKAEAWNKINKENAQVECEFCKEKFPMKSVEIKEQSVALVMGKILNIQYFECPFCKHKFLILIADKKMQDLMDERALLNFRIKKLVSKGKKVDQAMILKHDRIKGKIDSYLVLLKNKYSEVITQVLTEEEVGNTKSLPQANVEKEI